MSKRTERDVRKATGAGARGGGGTKPHIGTNRDEQAWRTNTTECGCNYPSAGLVGVVRIC